MVVSWQAINEARDTLERLVGELDGEYDGWEAAIEPR
jgi:Regulator of ribonuclease activity B